MSDFVHLLPPYRPHAALSNAERIAWIRVDRWLDLDQARLALARLEDLLTYPPRDRMPCLLLYGDTGMGKTKIIRKFLRDHPACFDKGTGSRPCRWSPCRCRPNLSSVTSTVNCWPRWARRSMGARMLIIDEIHAMLAGSFRQQRIFLNVIRFLANDLRVPLVCAGTDLARQALLTDPPIGRALRSPAPAASDE